MRLSDMRIHEGLSIVRLDGFRQAREGEEGYRDGIALPGSANWFCEQHGMAADVQSATGILRTDHDSSAEEPWVFSVLVGDRDIDAACRLARSAGYRIESVEEVDEPMAFGDGDGAGTVEILKHRDGWLILEN
jgi:hypothetical protein